MELFRGCVNAYGTHGIPEQKGLKWEIKKTAKTIRAPVTVELWEKHLRGEQPLGIIPIRENDTCFWGSIDVDDYANNLLGIIIRVEQMSIPLVPSRSKSGGLHLFLFCRVEVSAAVLQSALKNLAAQLGIASSEIFPKQTQILTERGDLGNWMVMPYFGSTYGGKLREQVGLRKTGAELTVEQFLDLAEKNRIECDRLQEWQELPTARRTANKIIREPFADGPVCLQMLAKLGIQAGGQNNALFHMGIYYKKSDPQNWKIRLEEANRSHLTPPGSTDGLLSVIHSLEKKDYQYMCKAEPMVSYCNATACRIRKYGIGNENDYPEISGLSKLNADPPIWFIDVNDLRLESSTHDLMFYLPFLKLCFEQLRVFNLMNQAQWIKLLKECMLSCVVNDASPEVSRIGEFKEKLEEFCTNRQKGRDKEDLLVGRPWECEEKRCHYFRLKDFQSFLIREGIRELTRAQITQRIKHFGGGTEFIKPKKDKGINVWYVPVELFEVKEPVAVPPMNEEPI